MNIKMLLTALCVSCTPALTGCYESYVVYGDSIASPRDSWVNQINAFHESMPDAGYPYMQNNSLPGQTLMNWDLPEWLYESRSSKAVIIALGTNDAGSGVPVAAFAEHLDSIIQRAQNATPRPLPVVCILAYDLSDTRFYAVDTAPYRQVQRDLCPAYIDILLELEDSPDGLHMGPIGQEKFALNLLIKLAETEH